ncbi:MAG: J domain-containing protein [Deltaproteobacteria bacterium]|nr:J domain-containing protein [Deltaproteobacteria bacterium]
MTVVSMTEANKACSILFGPQVKASLDFFTYLQPSGLKSAYRKKALETHPDRAGAVGEDRAVMTKRFLEATVAYQNLLPIIESNGAVLSPRPMYGSKGWERRPKKKTGPAARTDHVYAGDLPKRSLLIGQFLYYSGVISWKTLIDAIVWQRGQRPLIGQLARDWRKLSEHEIQIILMRRRLGEKFGECAIRAGYLTRFEVMALLGAQSRRQRPIGEYFLRQNILGTREMEHMLRRQQSHNRRVAAKSRF